ncbi:MAG: hypothetical protein ACI9MR_001069, partial [Myxococcota bacterium]
TGFLNQTSTLAGRHARMAHRHRLSRRKVVALVP